MVLCVYVLTGGELRGMKGRQTQHFTALGSDAVSVCHSSKGLTYAAWTQNRNTPITQFTLMENELNMTKLQCYKDITSEAEGDLYQALKGKIYILIYSEMHRFPTQAIVALFHLKGTLVVHSWISKYRP